jgi:hypothetical protein
MEAIQGPASITVCNVYSKRCKMSRIMHRPSGMDRNTVRR